MSWNKWTKGIFCCLGIFGLLNCAPLKKSVQPIVKMADSSEYPKTDAYLANLLRQYPQYFDSVLANNAQWQVRIIYTQIDRNQQNQPQLKHFYFNIDPRQYFYPASTIKMPVAALALQKINNLALSGLDKNTSMITETVSDELPGVYNDPSSADGRPTVAQYIKKIFLVSDNDAYNRLYEFLGQEELHNNLHRMGYDSVQLLHRLQLSLTEDQNRTGNPVKFFDSNASLIYQQPLKKSSMAYHPRQTLLGTGYMSNNKLVAQPFDFSKKNRIALTDLHTILQSIIFPETVLPKQRFNLTPDDYRFLHRYMSMMPAESDFPAYEATYNDAYVKFLLFGGSGKIADTSLRIFNKVGDAYGFLHDVAYIVNFEKGVEFMLTASIYCNSDGIFNDDKYDYEKVGFPFLKNLGQVIYDHELNRKKTHLPNLSKFRFDYRH